MELSGKYYILITPAKNEEANLPGLIASIVAQDIAPVGWFIVNDGSNDRTSEIITKAAVEYPWIHIVNIHDESTYDLGEHYAAVCIKGFESGFEYCEINKIAYEYIALSDADMIYPAEYFSKCIEYLCGDKNFGIVSGHIVIKKANGRISEEQRFQLGSGEPRGSCRVWRRVTFNDTNGYQLSKAPDTVSNVMAIIKGWKTAQLTNLICYQTRDTGGKNSLWKGGFNSGCAAHYLNVNPLTMINEIILSMLITRTKAAIVRSIAGLNGYCSSWIRRQPKSNNEEVKHYMSDTKNIVKHYLLFIKGLRDRNIISD